MARQNVNRKQHELSKYWYFTHNNADVNERYEEIVNHVNWGVFQYEMGSSGTPYMQGCIALKRQSKYDTVKGIFKANVDLLIARNIVTFVKYCMKEEGRISGPYKIGAIPDYEKLGSSIQNKKSKTVNKNMTLKEEVAYINECLLKNNYDFIQFYKQNIEIAKRHERYIDYVIKKNEESIPIICDNFYYRYGEPK
ncbi:hypothetical protein BDAP_002109 [Binucleata daphniae]